MKGYSYWWDTVGPRIPNPESRIPPQSDVVVIGAGYTGLAAARTLARAGASVVVIEREQIGWGASSRNGGQVLTGLKLDPAALVARFGEARARALFDVARASTANLERLIADEQIDCGYERVGHIQAAWKPSHFAAFRDEQALLARTFDHRVDIVSRAEQRSEIGTDAYHGLLIDQQSGAINPARYVAGLAAAAERAGARMVTGVTVTRVRRGAQRWRVTTSQGDVDAGDVLFATNGYTDGAAPALRRRFVPVGSYIIATEPLTTACAGAILPRRRVAFDTKHFLYYFRLTDDRRLLFGGRAEFTRPGPHTTERAAAILRRGMIGIFPELADAAIEYAWGGTVAFTRDQMPHAGKLEDGYYAGGYCGHGIAMATLLGGIIAQRIAGQPIDHSLVDDRFDPIPLYSGTPWFLPLVGAYYQVRDWLE